MKNMLRILTIIGFAAALSVVVFAQGAGPSQGAVTPVGAHGKHKPGIQAEILKQLDLSKDQMKQIRALHKSSAEQMKPLQQQLKALGKPATPADRNSPDRVALRDKIKAIAKETHESLMKILTPEQGKKFNELMKQYAAEHRAKKGAPKP